MYGSWAKIETKDSLVNPPPSATEARNASMLGRFVMVTAPVNLFYTLTPV